MKKDGGYEWYQSIGLPPIYTTFPPIKKKLKDPISIFCMSSRFYYLSDSPDACPSGYSVCPPDSTIYLIVLMLVLQDILPVLQILLSI
jgi:hypothetical protein